ncbi:MAG: hypothetical protein Q9191_005767 [Dirinaria sp. TL-2023a]
METTTEGERPRKRQRADSGSTTTDDDIVSLSKRSISPPVSKRISTHTSPNLHAASALTGEFTALINSSTVSSPIQLNRIPSLPAASNTDTLTLKDLLGDPLISECWLFNYLFDVDFIMRQFDQDVREAVQVKLVHGSWKSEDSNRIGIEAAMKRYSNVKAVTAHMPEMYGTHHSKMIIIFRRDDMAQIVILTANFIPGDWMMTQALWRSPLLPLLSEPASETGSPASLFPLGSGKRFKQDLLAYVRVYNRLASLATKLSLYDFGTVRGALVASVPRKQEIVSQHNTKHLWGLPGLARILGNISGVHRTASSKSKNLNKNDGGSSQDADSQGKEPAQIVIQISSVASVGEKWLRDFFFPTLSTTSTSPLAAQTSQSSSPSPETPRFSIIFPTASEIRRSVTGYSAGSSIHMRTRSSAQRKQLDYIRPMLCHWAGDNEDDDDNNNNNRSASTNAIQEAGRRRAAPHIKTYTRFRDPAMTRIDWAMLTSANLSSQAWGSATKDRHVRVCSYEIGVVVWPGLWGEEAEMVPVFKRDMPHCEGEEAVLRSKVTVGWRMPYDLPLVKYREGEMPWCASHTDTEVDWMGRSWPGFGAG